MDHELTCVLFPGIVKNVEKALECLGGTKAISQTYSYSQTSKKRLGLSFHPENPFVKKIYADFKPAAGILLKVKVKKTKTDNKDKREVVSTTIVGCVKKMYRFDSMCDFQFLPICNDVVSGGTKCILEQIHTSGLDNYKFLSEPAPFFIIPSSFARSDKPMHYGYSDKGHPLERKKPLPGADADTHNRTRTDRGAPVTRFSFNLVDDLPTEPHEYFVNQKNIKATTTTIPKLLEEYDVIEKMFEERPIWSSNMLKFRTKFKLMSLKIILPCVSFYMKNGPWRMNWVRYGYDPRKHPEARIYQTLDFRLRHTAGINSMVMKRDQVVQYKKGERAGTSMDVSDRDAAEEVAEGSVCFRPGMVPAQRQIFYQYCDVEIPEVQEIVGKEPPPGYLCHESRGWLAPNTGDICRDLIFRNVKETLFSTDNADLRIEQGSSGENSNSDEEISTANEMDDSYLDK